MYGAVLAVILAFRIPIWMERRRKPPRARRAALAASTDAA
jgi:hypothetical protein